MIRAPVLILGGGPAGLSLALFLKDRGIRAQVLEQANRAGGLAASYHIGAYTFDHSGHLLHTNNPKVIDLVQGRLGVKLDRIDRRSVCLIDGRFIPFPYQQNLFYQSPDRVREALVAFYHRRAREPRNFREWIHASSGDGIGRQFMYPYNAKLWNVDLRRMATDWVPRFIPAAGPKEILKSAFLERKDAWGYNAVFYYPARGGMGAVADRLAAAVDDRTTLRVRIRSINLKKRTVESSDGGVWKYDRLISTIPLPAFLRLSGMTTPAVCHATGVTVFNIGLNAPCPHDFHWCYVPDPSIPFYRFGVYSNISRAAAPRGASSLYVECAARPDCLSKFEFPDVRRHLLRLGVVRRAKDIEVVHRLDLRHAYPVPLIGLARWREKLTNRLRGHGVGLLGRFGAWRYVAISDVIVEAGELSKQIADVSHE